MKRKLKSSWCWEQRNPEECSPRVLAANFSFYNGSPFLIAINVKCILQQRLVAVAFYYILYNIQHCINTNYIYIKILTSYRNQTTPSWGVVTRYLSTTEFCYKYLLFSFLDTTEKNHFLRDSSTNKPILMMTKDKTKTTFTINDAPLNKWNNIRVTIIRRSQTYMQMLTTIRCSQGSCI